jgi:polyisoprenoid-binding protein YceI
MLTFLLLVACTSELDNKTSADVKHEISEEKTVQRQSKSTNTRELQIDPSSKIEWVGSKVSGDHRGGFEKSFGKVIISGTEKNIKVEELHARFDVKSLFSDSKKLTQHLLSPDFFDAEGFPEASFRMIRYDDAKMTGILTLRGVQKEISFPCEMTVDIKRVSIKTEFTINRKDFGIVYPGRPDDLIRDEVLLKLEVKYK